VEVSSEKSTWSETMAQEGRQRMAREVQDGVTACDTVVDSRHMYSFLEAAGYGYGRTFQQPETSVVAARRRGRPPPRSRCSRRRLSRTSFIPLPSTLLFICASLVSRRVARNPWPRPSRHASAPCGFFSLGVILAH
jgi:hypothetical protein